MIRSGLAVVAAVAVMAAPCPAHPGQRSSPPLQPPKPKAVTSRAGNTQGVVPVLMYHKLGRAEKYMVRSYANFRRDLERLYTLGFRPVTLEEYAENRMSLPPGASPVVITFDDSHETQLSLDAQGRVRPNTFVAIWQDFAASHPDFPVKGTFFLNDNGPFGSSKTGPQAVKLLQKLGSEVASHTLMHGNLRKSSEAAAARDMGGSIIKLRRMGVEPTSFAPPYGVYPKRAGMLTSFTYQGQKFGFKRAVLAGDRPAPSPVSKRFDRMRIPRIIVAPVEGGFDTWMARMKAGRPAPYVQPAPKES
jgi:peptidoglycan/xylan/chitin deacetylase (PgdA/CDA1 family)